MNNKLTLALSIVTLIGSIAAGVYAVDSKYATKSEVVQSLDQFYDKMEIRELYRRKEMLEDKKRDLKQFIRSNEAMSMSTFDASEDLKEIEQEITTIKEQLKK